MANEPNSYVASLLRKRGHLNRTADTAKIQEVDEALRLAGVDPDEEARKASKAREEPVPERHAPKLETTAREATPLRRGIQGKRR
jgi:hypothetical protein